MTQTQSTIGEDARTNTSDNPPVSAKHQQFLIVCAHDGDDCMVEIPTSCSRNTMERARIGGNSTC